MTAEHYNHLILLSCLVPPKVKFTKTVLWGTWKIDREMFPAYGYIITDNIYQQYTATSIFIAN